MIITIKVHYYEQVRIDLDNLPSYESQIANTYSSYEDDHYKWLKFCRKYDYDSTNKDKESYEYKRFKKCLALELI